MSKEKILLSSIGMIIGIAFGILLKAILLIVLSMLVFGLIGMFAAEIIELHKKGRSVSEIFSTSAVLLTLLALFVLAIIEILIVVGY